MAFFNEQNAKALPHIDGHGDFAVETCVTPYAVAMLLEIYPDQEIYFLARWVAKDNPATSKRLHLLNVSRANMKAEHFRDYLEQEGIN